MNENKIHRYSKTIKIKIICQGVTTAQNPNTSIFLIVRCFDGSFFLIVIYCLTFLQVFGRKPIKSNKSLEGNNLHNSLAVTYYFL